MRLIKLNFACFLFIAAAFAIVHGFEQAASPNMQLCKHQYALCTSALCIPQPDDPAKAICFCDVEEGARARACPRRLATPSDLAPDANGIRTVYSSFSFNNSSRVRKSLRVPAALLGHGASISVARSTPQTPRRRSVPATYCELENGLRWAAIATAPPARQDMGPAQRQRTSTKRALLWSRHSTSTSLPLSGAKPPTHETDSLRGPVLGTPLAALFFSFRPPPFLQRDGMQVPLLERWPTAFIDVDAQPRNAQTTINKKTPI
jgi:hypothetical protein